jgi:hypothetical protein
MAQETFDEHSEFGIWLRLYTAALTGICSTEAAVPGEEPAWCARLARDCSQLARDVANIAIGHVRSAAERYDTVERADWIKRAQEEE